MIVTMVPPKSGRLASGAYESESPIMGDVFGWKGRPLPPAKVGRSYNTMSHSDKNPLDSFHNTATTPDIEPHTSVGTTKIVRSLGRTKGHNVPEVMPHEHGRFFGEKILTVVRNTGGPKASHDTAFHAKPKQIVKNRPERRPASFLAERSSQPSFHSANRLLSDAQFQPHGGASRWATVKRGAAG